MANITKVYLLSVPLEDDYKDTLYFANATAQQTYFAGQVVKSYTDFSYQRKDNVIRVPAQVDTIRNCNYVMYQNTAYSNKWFYAFIESMVYVDDNRTDIHITTDVLQTWMFEMQFKDSFIEREHVNNDTVGLHTIPEGLDTGTYVCNDVQDFRIADTYTFPKSVNDATMIAIVMVSSLVIKYDDSRNPVQYLEPSSTWNMTNSTPQGLNIVGVPVCEDCLGGLYALAGMYDTNGRGDCIQSMFLYPFQNSAWVPYDIHGLSGNVTIGPWTFPVSALSEFYFEPVDSTGYSTLGNIDDNFNNNFTISLNNTINGYTPKNNKCKTKDYNYFTITNNDGVEIAFAYEDFISTPTFKVIGSFEQGGSTMCLPYNSKKTTTANSALNGWTEGIPGGKFPQLSWTSDYYLNWQAQNGKYLETSLTLGALNMGTSVIDSMLHGATSNFGAYDTALRRADNLANLYGPNPTNQQYRSIANAYGAYDAMSGASPAGGVGMLGAVTDYASQVANVMHQTQVAMLTPQQAKGNASTGTLAYATNALGRFTARKMSCKQEYIKAVDDYFSMFGYKVNRLGIPLTNHRQNWWYTKTVNANIDGNIPNEDMKTIKSIYNSGVTYWKNPANIKNYSVSNNIV